MKHPVARAIVAGFGWGVLVAIMMGRRGLLVLALPMIGVGPVIGLIVYIASMRVYRGSKVVLALWAIPSLYLATSLLSVAFALLWPSGMRDCVMNVWENVFWAWYGLSMPSWYWLLFPLAFVTHLWVRAAGERRVGS